MLQKIYITTTALSLIDNHQQLDLHIAGRLDLNSTGLLIFTNDGRWSSKLTSPGANTPKSYLVTLKKELTYDYINAFANGMYFAFEDITTQPAQLTILSKHQARVVLFEGKYHQIKRMFGRFRNEVLALHRESIGPLTLDTDLPEGRYRALSKIEIAAISEL